MRAPHNGPCGKTLTCRPLHLRHRLKYRAVPAQFALSGAPNLKLRRILPAIACTAPASLARPASNDLENIRVVPNPFSLSATKLQFPSQPNKIAFYNLPEECTIRLFYS